MSEETTQERPHPIKPRAGLQGFTKQKLIDYVNELEAKVLGMHQELIAFDDTLAMASKQRDDRIAELNDIIKTGKAANESQLRQVTELREDRVKLNRLLGERQETITALQTKVLEYKEELKEMTASREQLLDAHCDAIKSITSK